MQELGPGLEQVLSYRKEELAAASGEVGLDSEEETAEEKEAAWVVEGQT